MKHIVYIFGFILFAILWPIARIFCMFDKHSGLEIKHSHLKNGIEVVSKHEIHCSVCDKVKVYK